MIAKYVYFALVVSLLVPAILASLLPAMPEYVLPKATAEDIPETPVIEASEDDPVTFQHFHWVSVNGIRFNSHPILSWVIAISGITFLACIAWMVFTQPGDSSFDFPSQN